MQSITGKRIPQRLKLILFYFIFLVFPRPKLYFLLNFAHYGLKAAVFSLIFDLDEINLLWYLNCIDYRYFYLPNLNTITYI